MLELLRTPETLLGHVVDLGGGCLRIKHPDGRLLTVSEASERVACLLDRATSGRSLGPTLDDDASLVVRLRREGFLVPKALRRPRVALIGSGPLAIAMAVALSTRTTVELLCLDHVSPGSTTEPDIGARRSVRAYFEGRTVPDHVTLSQRPWGDLRACDTDLVIVAGSGIEADRLVGIHLTRQGVVHLFASCDAMSATVGPLVVPGRTACLNCTDLARTRIDHRWPATLSKLSTSHGGSRPVYNEWACSTLLLEIDWWFEHGTSQLTSTSVTVSRQRVGSGSRTWEPDPRCACARRERTSLASAA